MTPALAASHHVQCFTRWNEISIDEGHVLVQVYAVQRHPVAGAPVPFTQAFWRQERSYLLGRLFCQV